MREKLSFEERGFLDMLNGREVGVLEESFRGLCFFGGIFFLS